MNAYGKRMVLIYKTHMHSGAALNTLQCTTKSDRNAGQKWLGNTLTQLDHHQEIDSPPIEGKQDEDMGEQFHHGGIQGEHMTHQHELPPSGSGPQLLARGTTYTFAKDHADETRQPPGVAHMRFGTPEPPSKPRGATAATSTRARDRQNKFTPLKEHGNFYGGRYIEARSSGILKEGTTSVASNSRGSRDRDPIPLTPEVLHLLDRLDEENKLDYSRST
jgi:hypothetical protein